jgi:hypothetical protein
MGPGRNSFANKTFQLLAQCANKKSGSLEIHRNAIEARSIQAQESGSGLERGKGAAKVADPVHPVVRDFKCQKAAARTQHPKNFGKEPVLLLARF